MPSSKTSPQRFRSILPFIPRFGDAETSGLLPGEELPLGAIARSNLLSVLSSMVPGAFEEAVERYSSVDRPFRGVRGLAWTDPLRGEALSWAADWNLGDES